MALHGFEQVLKLAGLTLDDVTVVELDVAPSRLLSPRSDRQPRSGEIYGIGALLDGRVDAIYGKGAAFAGQVHESGLVVAVDLDALPARRSRVNNGTPRPVTVHQRLIEERPELVVRFLAASLRASDWAAEHPVEVREILERETFSGPSGVAAAHQSDFHLSLHPELTDERLELFAIQKQFLYTHGFIQHDFDLEAWVAREPLEEARALVTGPAVLSA
jgi:ABC-type nitrate/sulfonate/bicarbonate transport system substrate-binding protein